MGYILRKYQEKAVLDGMEFFYSDNKKNMIEVLPTAAGKSLIIASIAHYLDEPVLVTQPSKELLEQNYLKYINYGNKAGIYSASIMRKEIKNVTFATIQSIYKKPELFEKFKYLIVDECHLMSPRVGDETKEASMYIKFLENLNLKMLGLTATPFRLKSFSYPEPHSKLCMLNQQRPKIFHDIIHVTQIKELIEGGYWADLIYVNKDFDRSFLVGRGNGSEFTEESVIMSLKEQGTIQSCIEWVKNLRKEGCKKILVFAPSIAVSEYIAKKVRCFSISSNTNKSDREYILNRFISGTDNCISNVNVLSVGFDCQQIDAIIDLNPTNSLAKYYQKIGRGVRVDLSPNPIKQDCIIVDLVGNGLIFGKIEDLEIKKIEGKWAVKSGNRILTNIPLQPITVSDPEKILKEYEENIMEFGRFKDQKFKDVPKWYFKYVLNKFKEEEKYLELFKYARSLF